MTNNDVLRRIRYIFDFSDDKMIAVFGLGQAPVTRAQVSDWLKREEDPAYCECSDPLLAAFLNGLITDKRGKRDGPAPVAEAQLTNNLILTKLKIALAYSADDMMAALNAGGYRMSKHELSALFRKPGHKHHRQCMDQILRNFLRGLQLTLRPEA